MFVILPDKLYSLFYKCSIIYHCDSVKNAPNKYLNPRSFRVRIFMFKDLWEVLFSILDFQVCSPWVRGPGWTSALSTRTAAASMMAPGPPLTAPTGSSGPPGHGSFRRSSVTRKIRPRGKQDAVVIGISNVIIPFQDLLLWTRRRKMIVLPNIFMMNTRMTPPCSTLLVK